MFNYQWDTGINTPTFTGNTPYSLDRGDIFNVLPGETPIFADELDDNNAFVSAYDLGLLADAANSVNARTVDGNLNLHVKGDRDYYRFTAPAPGAWMSTSIVIDSLGDNLRFMIYEVNPILRSEEVPMFTIPNVSPAYFIVNAGDTNTLAANVVGGREYILEVLSNESKNIGVDALGKSFNYGTARTYGLSIECSRRRADRWWRWRWWWRWWRRWWWRWRRWRGGGGIGGIPPGGSQPGAPTVINVGPVTPATRSVAIGDVFIEFSEDVTGFDIADLKLTRGGVNVPLTGLTRDVDQCRLLLRESRLCDRHGRQLCADIDGDGIRHQRYGQRAARHWWQHLHGPLPTPSPALWTRRIQIRVTDLRRISPATDRCVPP